MPEYDNTIAEVGIADLVEDPFHSIYSNIIWWESVNTRNSRYHFKSIKIRMPLVYFTVGEIQGVEIILNVFLFSI